MGEKVMAYSWKQYEHYDKSLERHYFIDEHDILQGVAIITRMRDLHGVPVPLGLAGAYKIQCASETSYSDAGQTLADLKKYCETMLALDGVRLRD
jgi:hypothetical protein